MCLSILCRSVCINDHEVFCYIHINGFFFFFFFFFFLLSNNYMFINMYIIYNLQYIHQLFSQYNMFEQDNLSRNLEKMVSGQAKVVTSLQQQRQFLKQIEVG